MHLTCSPADGNGNLDEKASAVRDIRSGPAGDVQFVYHTYHGFIAFFIQTEHRVSCPPEQARILLGRFLRFNLTWGMLSYGMVFVPFLAFFNYLAQKSAINRAESQFR